MKVLVTGGAGSIGREVVTRLVSVGHDVTALDINEEGLWLLGLDEPQVNLVVGDIIWDMHHFGIGQDAIIHCAALKHVHFCEQNPIASHRVNVSGTKEVVDATSPDTRLVFLSTDKAVDPENVLGRHKSEAEALVMKAGGNVVRFGNVIGSRGSLLPMVRHYRHRDIPITDRRMTRFFISIHEAVDIVMKALDAVRGGQVFGSIAPQSARVEDFLEVCRDVYAPGSKIVEIGPRPGERLHECLVTDKGRTWSNDPCCLMDKARIEKLVGLTATLTT